MTLAYDDAFDGEPDGRWTIESAQRAVNPLRHGSDSRHTRKKIYRLHPLQIRVDVDGDQVIAAIRLHEDYEKYRSLLTEAERKLVFSRQWSAESHDQHARAVEAARETISSASVVIRRGSADVLSRNFMQRTIMRGIAAVASVMGIAQLIAAWAAMEAGRLEGVFTSGVIAVVCIVLVGGATRYLSRLQESSAA